MATITEDYVSFETAKLLKEKGFQQLQDNCGYFTTEMVYSINVDDSGEHHFAHQYPAGVSNKDKYIAAPTLSMAMKWLREVHNLVICAEIGNENDKGNTDYSNPDRWYWFFDITNEKGVVIETESDYILNEYPSYENACEAAIKYCLEKLI